MSRTGSSSKRQAGNSHPPIVPAIPPAAIELQRECAALRDRVAGYLAQKPPRRAAAQACTIRLHSLNTQLLQIETAMRITRRVIPMPDTFTPIGSAAQKVLDSLKHAQRTPEDRARSDEKVVETLNKFTEIQKGKSK